MYMYMYALSYGPGLILTSDLCDGMGERAGVSVVKGEVSLLLSAIRRNNRWMGHGRVVSQILLPSSCCTVHTTGHHVQYAC